MYIYLTHELKTIPEEAIEIADSNRLIPVHDANATSPEDVYKLSDIIPDAEFNAIPVAEVLSADSIEERIAYMPYKRSEWVRQNLRSIFDQGKPNRKKLYAFNMSGL